MKRQCFLLIYFGVISSLVLIAYYCFNNDLVLLKKTFSYIEDNSTRLDYEHEAEFCDDVCLLLFNDDVKKEDIVSAVHKVKDGGASVIGVDFLFEKDVPNSADSLIVKMASEDERVVLTYNLEEQDGKLITKFYNGIDEFSDVHSMGYTNLGMINGSNRRLNKYQILSGEKRTSFATTLSELYLGHKTKDPRDLINFVIRTHQYDYDDSLVLDQIVKNKVVILGCKTLNDYKSTPAGLMFGAETHAIAVATILKNERNRISLFELIVWPFLITVIFTALLVFVSFRSHIQKSRVLSTMNFIVGGLLVLFSVFLFMLVPSFDDYWWSLASIPVISELIYSMTKELSLWIYRLTDNKKINASDITHVE